MCELTVSTRMAFAKAWCEEVAYWYDVVMRKEAKVREAEAAIDGIKGISYESFGSGSSPTTGDEAMAERIMKVEQDRASAANARLEAMESSRRFDESLDQMRNQTYARLLAMRYEERAGWHNIADALGYSENHVRNYMHNAALIDLYDFMPEQLQVPTAI